LGSIDRAAREFFRAQFEGEIYSSLPGVVRTGVQDLDPARSFVEPINDRRPRTFAIRFGKVGSISTA
jgi:hypothetical protein